ncbi:MAG: glucose 1-dehydrogenase [Deltaproteobacteria bacterium]|nr:glucose 1-dehydrogenase [Deltaproteobacteria bacterium]
MKAIAIFPERRAVELIEAPAPRLASPTDVCVRILDVGICGTDKELCAFKYGTPPPGNDHLVIGHESLGEVVEVGPAVTRVAIGDLVVPMVRRPCPHAECLACAAGRQDFCSTGDYTERGIKGRHGFMTESVVDDERWMNPLPRALRGVGVLVEPLTIAEKALVQVRLVQQRLPWARAARGAAASGQRAVVLGAGPVGLLGAMALVAAGFETFVYSLGGAASPRARIARDIGVTFVEAEAVEVAALPERVGAIDVVYEATGASRLSFDVLAVLGANGVFVFTGVPGRRAPVEVDTDLLMRNLVLKNQVVLGSVNASRADFEAAIRDLAIFQSRWPEALGALLTGRVPIDDGTELLRDPPAGAIKNVIAVS